MTNEKDDVRSLDPKFSEIIDNIESEAHDKIKNLKCVSCDNEAVFLIKRYLSYIICHNCFRPIWFKKGESITFLKDLDVIGMTFGVVSDD